MTLTATQAGNDYVALQRVLQEWVVNGTLLPDGNVYWMDQNGPRAAGPAVAMRLSTFSSYGRDWLDHATNTLLINGLTFTRSGNQIVIDASNLRTGDGPVQFTTTGVLPAPLALNTNYWVVVDDVGHARLSTRFVDAMNGQPSAPAPVTIALTDAGTGVHTLTSTSDTLRAGQEIVWKGRGFRRVTLSLQCHATKGVGMDMALSILGAITARYVLPSQRDILWGTGISVTAMGTVKPVRGGGVVINSAIFEPRAVLDVVFGLSSEVTELGTIIERADITNLVTGQTRRVPTE